MADRDRRRSPPQVVTVLAVAAVLAHAYGLYRPTGPPSLSGFPAADKVEHFFGFGVPLWLVLQARRAALNRAGSVTTAEPRRVSRRFVLGVTAAFVLNAILSELAQYAFYVHRTGDPLDTLADLLGVFLGLAAARWSDRRHSLTGPGPADAADVPHPPRRPRPVERP